MTDKQLALLMAVKIPFIVDKISKKYKISQEEACLQFYNSKIYEKLSDAGTGVWHFSVPLICELYDEEKRTGKIIFPEEAA
jgi:hypothetical protein